MLSFDEIQEIIELLKSLAQHVTTRDVYHFYGEYIAHTLRECGRSKREISAAQHKISEIIFNLEMGYFCDNAAQFTRISPFSHLKDKGNQSFQ